MVRVCLVFPLVLILCVGSSIAIKCYACNDVTLARPEPCDESKGPGNLTECPSPTIQTYCHTRNEYNIYGKLAAKMCADTELINHLKKTYTVKSSDCYSDPNQPKAKHCFCNTNECTPSEWELFSWKNLLWIGIILVFIGIVFRVAYPRGLWLSRFSYYPVKTAEYS